MYFTLPFKDLTWTCPSSKNIPSTFLSFDPVYCLTSEGLALFIYSAFHFCSHPRLPYVTVFLIFSPDADPFISGQNALGDPQTVSIYFILFFPFPESWRWAFAGLSPFTCKTLGHHAWSAYVVSFSSWGDSASILCICEVWRFYIIINITNSILIEFCLWK